MVNVMREHRHSRHTSSRTKCIFILFLFFDFTWEETCQHRKAPSIMTIELIVQRTVNVNDAKAQEMNALF